MPIYDRLRSFNPFRSINCWRALARQHTILYISGENPKFVGCKIGSMLSWLVFMIRDIHACDEVSYKCTWKEITQGPRRIHTCFRCLPRVAIHSGKIPIRISEISVCRMERYFPLQRANISSSKDDPVLPRYR